MRTEPHGEPPSGDPWLVPLAPATPRAEAGPPPDLRRSSGGAVPGRPRPFDAGRADPNGSFRRECPACGGRRVRVLIPEGEHDNMYKFSNFRVFQDRACKDCGQRWTPPCPRWAAYCCVAAGLLLLVLAAGVVVWCLREYRDGGLLLAACVGLLPGVAGATALVYGVGTLAGRLGRLTMR